MWLCCILFCFCSDDNNPGFVNDPDPMDSPFPDTLRLASYNVSMFGSAEGQIAMRMETPDQYTRYKRLAAVIQHVRPDILVLMEFDYDSSGNALRNFNDKLLNISQAGDSAIQYDYTYQIISNTGVLSGADLDNDGELGIPGDAYGFGNFPGQYASAILSRFPINTNKIVSFRDFLWKDMPGALLPVDNNGNSYYSEEALEVFRLSSKNHTDIPVVLPDGDELHLLVSHPTPPGFDGAENRNGRRNHDEIRLWADYINNKSYLIDDSGNKGGLEDDVDFVVIGDLNADPVDGDSYPGAISQLLDDPKINQDVANGGLIPSSLGGQAHNARAGDSGNPGFDTAFFGLRVDYVLPSSGLPAVASGVFWPAENEPLHDIVKDGRASDHLLVWVDIVIE